MTPFSGVVYAEEGISLSKQHLLWAHKLNALPIIDKEGRLTHFVFHKDYKSEKL